MIERRPGTILDGKYEILERLGGGGMGEVYLVRHLHLEERRVIKVLRPEHATDPAAQKRFLRAARTATQIKHPNVAILYDYSSLPDGSFYIVWEYIEGEEVGHRIESRGPFPPPEAIALGIQALRGLEAIHSAGVIHRDISPDNLMITRDVRDQPRLKIIDLGLAKNLGQPDFDVTQAGTFLGKLRYCSPEQAEAVKGVTLDRRSDLYSFTVVFYEMLCGKPPFESESAHGFVFKRLTEEHLPLAGRLPDLPVPEELEQLIRKGLARDREERFSTAVEIIEALERVQRRIAEVSTQEVPKQVAEQVPEPVPKPAPPAAAEPSPAAPPPAARRRSSSQLSREERDALLAQIDRAARRTREISGLLARADSALAAGRLAEARELAARIAADHPRARGLTELTERLRRAEAGEEAPAAVETEGAERGAPEAVAGGEPAPEGRGAGTPAAATAELPGEGADPERVAAAAGMLRTYLDNRQLHLARLALETLVGLAPDHPERQRFAARIDELAGQEKGRRRAAAALASGREALAAGDLDAVRRRLAELRRQDPSGELAAELEGELDRAAADEERGARAEERRHRLEELLGEERLEEAEGELAALAELGLPKVTLDPYRERLAAARRRADEEARGGPFEERFRERLEAGDWAGARDAALAMEEALPASSRPAEMFAEAARREAEGRRREAVDQGARQVEEFIARGELEQAETALAVLLRLAPDHPRRQQLTAKLQTLRQA